MISITNIKAVERALIKETESLIEKLFQRTKYQIREIVRNTILGNLRKHPTYISISSGQYNGHFGFYPDTGLDRMQVITKEIVDNLDVKLQRVKNLISMEAFIDYDTLYKLEEAKVYNNSTNAKNGLTSDTLDWLKWLLEAGGKVAVMGYHISFDASNHNNPRSRSKEALMIQGGSWSVPASIAGTISNNWITQSLKSSESSLSPDLKRFIVSEFNKL